ncbi:hypothetical protein UC8_13730 [Roseimaritima ulvae]|uniref:Uncharacterized protein n=1 Tax=Roseimaritima ulvae TaxID=980254 RepID=A0A5B9QQT7_9BACT|nr:hypothetical protein UC8_13730 [Roseimaritima ulvae]
MLEWQGVWVLRPAAVFLMLRVFSVCRLKTP